MRFFFCVFSSLVSKIKCLSGIYIHIPFCRRACDYCDFHFSTSLQLKSKTVDAICAELEQRALKWQSEPVNTIYFGGGTPSLLNSGELTQIMQAVKKNYPIGNEPEITFEANPDDINADVLKTWISAGINRLSIGVQSFINRDLQYMERIHDARLAEDAVKMAQQAGISNITIDLIYGTPGMSDAEWEANLRKAAGLNVPHISAYALTVEDKTPLFHRIRKKQKAAPDESATADQFLFMVSFLAQHGYQQYEVSNFAKPGLESRHNSAYWEGVPYLGIGPSAHSFDGFRRRMNIANNARYIQAFEKNEPNYFDEEVLTEDDRYNEYLLTRLRTRKGLVKEDFEKYFSPGEWVALLEELDELPESFLSVTEDAISLSTEGLLHADGIASDLFR